MTPDDSGPRPRYQWRADAHAHHIFEGYDGERQIGRIALHHNGWWDWNLTFRHGLRSTAAHVYGNEDTARLAAKACEDCYDAVMGASWPGVSHEDVERLLENERYQRGRNLGGA